MAINPATQYPGKIDTSDPVGYPYGKAQNVTVSGDGTGTPWEKAIVNDLFGLGQALLSETGITPTGTPDKVGASQYLQALLALRTKNYIVNPSMAVSQENGDGPDSFGGTAYYVADQWFVQNDTGTGAMTAEIGSLSGLRSAKVTATSAVSDLSGTKKATGPMTNIEAANIEHLNSKLVTFSFDVRVNWTGLLSLSFRAGGANRSYVTDIAVTSGEQSVSVTVPMESNTVDSGSSDLGLFIMIGRNNEGTQQTATVDQWQDGLSVCSDNSTQWAKSAGNYVEITAVKLEQGTVASAFEPNSYAADLAECQPYGQIVHAAGGGQASIGGDDFDSSCNFSVTMRDSPVTTSLGTGGDLNVASSALSNVTPEGARYIVTSTAGGRTVRTETFFLNARL